MRRRVVITGAGWITPLGVEVVEVWRLLAEGRSGMGPITLFDASNFPVRIAAEVSDWDISEVGEDPARWQHQARQTTFAVAAGLKAGRQAGLERAAVDPLRMGVYLGCGETFPDLSQFGQLISDALEGGRFKPEKFIQTARRIWSPDDGLEYEPGMAASYLSGLFNAQGPNFNCVTACASSSQAIGEATEIIRLGDADVMLAGGAHSMIHPLGITGFLLLSTLATHNEEPEKAMRPFDRNRNGFVVGEGAAVVVLEELEHAKRRRVEIWAELSGYGSTQDAFRITDLHPEGRGAATCIRLALADARLNPDDIDYINAHGTGTVVNDRVETLVVKRTFGQLAYKVPMSSTKSMMGHSTTAGGATELVASLMAIRMGVVPPTINYETPDPQCDLDYVPNTAREIPCRHVLSNSFGFGGQNVALIVSRYNGRAA